MNARRSAPRPRLPVVLLAGVMLLGVVDAVGVAATANGSLAASDAPSHGRPGRYADFYTLTGSGSVVITMTGLDSYLFLYDAALQQVASNDDGAGNRGSKITYALQSGRTYCVEATAYPANLTGNYVLTTSAGSLAATSNPWSGGTSIDGALAASDPPSHGRAGRYADYYKLTGDRATTVSMTGIKSFLYLYDADLKPLGNDAKRINSVLRSGSTCYVEATSYDPAVTGNYTIATTLGKLEATDNPWRTGKKIVLLLHGMNSNYKTWNQFVAVAPGAGTDVYLGRIRGGAITQYSSTDYKGVMYYAVEFGTYDASSGRKGVEGTSAQPGPVFPSQGGGDFSTFDSLGREVDQALTKLLKTYPRAQIALVAHSRGGLAARAFLQSDSTTASKDCVVALLTIGTPHQASRLGRINGYIASHPRQKAAAQGGDPPTWTAVDWIRDHGLDVRRPTIADLTDGSAAIVKLNGAVSKLPAVGVKHGFVPCRGARIGFLSSIPLFDDYSIFPGEGTTRFNLPRVSRAAADSILDGRTPGDAAYDGDGIVPNASQRLTSVSPSLPVQAYGDVSGTYHGDETGRTRELGDALKAMTGWWK